MAQDARQLPQRLPPGQEVKIGAAEAAGPDADDHLARSRMRDRALPHLQAPAVAGHQHGLHAPAHGYSFNPVIAMPWMKDRWRKKKSRIMGSVPMAATARS